MTTWVGVLPVFGLSLLLLWGPGLVGAWLLGLRGLTTWWVAPLFSVSLLGVLGVLCSLLGVQWGWLPLLAGVALLGAASWGIGRWTSADGPSDGCATADRPTAGTPTAGMTLAGVGGWVFGVVMVLTVVLPRMGNPTRFPQAYDSPFHVNVIEWMVQHHDISVTHGQAILSTTGTGFYPAVFHGFAASVAMVTGASPVVAGNVLAVVVSGPVWVAGCLLLVRQVMGPSRLALVVTGLTSTMFPCFPYYFLGHGVHWPNSLGYALLPAMLACVLSLVGPAVQDVLGRRRAVVLLVAGTPGVLLAHPNALVALVVLAYLIVAVRVLPLMARSLRRRRWVPSAVLIAGLVAIPAVGLVASRTVPMLRSVSDFDWPARQRLPQGFGEIVLLAPNDGRAAWVSVALIVLGIVLVARRGGPWWPVVSFAVIGMLYVLASSVDSGLSQLLTGLWYNDSGRLAALLPIALTPLATIAIVALVRRVARSQLTTGASAVMVLAVLLVITGGGYHGDSGHELLAYHQYPGTQVYATRGEQQALVRLGAALPRDAIVASNPWNGSQLLYALTGRRVLFGHFKPPLVGDRQVLAQSADAVAQDPQVCASLRSLGVQYVLTTDKRPRYWPWNVRTRAYPGLDAITAQTPGYQLVEHRAPYSLWRVSACS